MIKLKDLIKEDKIKPAFAKKAKDAIEKVLGTTVEFDGQNEFKVKVTIYIKKILGCCCRRCYGCVF